MTGSCSVRVGESENPDELARIYDSERYISGSRAPDDEDVSPVITPDSTCVGWWLGNKMDSIQHGAYKQDLRKQINNPMPGRERERSLDWEI